MKFGEKLKKLRLDRHVSQEDCARAAGITRRAYIGYEQEGRYPRKRETYAALASFLSVDTNYLLTEDEEFATSAREQYSTHGRGRLQAEELVTELSAMFAGGEMSEEDKDAVMLALQKAYWDYKQDNRKYPQEKYC